MSTLRQGSPRGAACARRRGWTATPGRPRSGWIRSSGARGNLWSRGVTAREAFGSRSRRAAPETPATTTTRRRTRRRRQARCSGRCSRRKEAAGGSAGAGGRRRHRRRSMRTARCAWRSSVRATCWRTSPAPTASTGPAPCPGSRSPPAAPSAAPPSTSPPTNRAQRRRVGRVTPVLVWRGTCTYRYRLQQTAERRQTNMPWQRTRCLVSRSPACPAGWRLAVRGVAAGALLLLLPCTTAVVAGVSRACGAGARTDVSRKGRGLHVALDRVDYFRFCCCFLRLPGRCASCVL